MGYEKLMSQREAFRKYDKQCAIMGGGVIHRLFNIFQKRGHYENG